MSKLKIKFCVAYSKFTATDLSKRDLDIIKALLDSLNIGYTVYVEAKNEKNYD